MKKKEYRIINFKLIINLLLMLISIAFVILFVLMFINLIIEGIIKENIVLGIILLIVCVALWTKKIIIDIFFVKVKEEFIDVKRREITSYKNLYSNTYVRDFYRNKAILEKIKIIEPDFNGDYFEEWTKQLFKNHQQTLSERDLEKLKTMEMELLFNQHAKQIEEDISAKQINKIEDVNVNFVDLYSFVQENEKDILTVIISSTMLNYIMDEETGKVLKGSRENYITNIYKLTFIRKKGITMSNQNYNPNKEINCPNCGANIVVRFYGKCEYCNTFIITDEHDWLLADIERV